MSVLDQAINGNANVSQDNPAMSFKDFYTQNEGMSMERTSTPLYTKTHQETGEKEEVFGAKMYTKGGATIMMVLSRNSAKSDFGALMSRANTLSVRSQHYVDSNGVERTQHILCSGVEGDGNIIAPVF